MRLFRRSRKSDLLGPVDRIAQLSSTNLELRRLWHCAKDERDTLREALEQAYRDLTFIADGGPRTAQERKTVAIQTLAAALHPESEEKTR